MINKLTDFGINLERTGIHTRRTIMIDDLNRSLNYSESLSPSDYKELVVTENCFGKKY